MQIVFLDHIAQKAFIFILFILFFKYLNFP